MFKFLRWPGPSPKRSRWPLGVALMALAFLNACSTLQLGYGQLPRLAQWWITDYLELDRAQRQQLGDTLREFQAWHQREEIPRLQALLSQAQAAAGDGVSEADLREAESLAQASVRRSLEHAAVLAGPWLATLRPAQWEELEVRMAERRVKWLKDQTEMSPQERREARAKSFVKGLERWTGRLDPAQRERAQRLVQSWPVVPAPAAVATSARAGGGASGQPALSERQRDTLAALRAWAAGQSARGVALMLGEDPTRSAPKEEPALAQAVRSSIVDVLQAGSPAQRQRMRAHWQSWQDDLRALRQAADGA